jgi:hypothetical protein
VCDAAVDALTRTSRPRVVSTTSYEADLPSRVTDLTAAPAGKVCPTVSVQPAGAETRVVYREPLCEAEAAIVPPPTLRSCTERLPEGASGLMPRKSLITGHLIPYEDYACMSIARSRKSTNGSYWGLGAISGSALGISRSGVPDLES